MKRIALFVLTGLLLSSCVPDKKEDKYTVIFHSQSDPNGLHPINSSSGTKSHIFNYTQQTLLRSDLETLESVPVLLKSLPTVDETGKVYTYEMLENATWDDGTPITTQDVVFTVKATLCPLSDNAAFRSNYTSVIDSIGLDPENGKFKFKLYTKEAQWADNQIFYQIYLQPAHILDAQNTVRNISFKSLQDTAWKASETEQAWFTDFNDASNAFQVENLYGSGPYEVVSWEQGQYLILEKKKNWWGKGIDSPYFQANPNRIVFKIVADMANAKLALINGEFDVSTNIGTKDLMELAKDSAFTNKYYYRFNDQFNFTYIAFNTKPKEGINPIFKDLELRKAIALLSPVQEMIDTYLGEHGRRMLGPEFELKPIFNPALKPIPLDVAEAKRVLGNAGWEDLNGDGILEKVIDGKRRDCAFTITYMDAPDIKEICLLTQTYLAMAGIKMETKGVQFQEFVQAVLGQNFEAAFGSWGGSGNYQNPYQLWHTDSWKNNGANFSGFGNAYSDSLIDETNRATQKEDFERAYFAFQQEVYDQQPYVFLYSNMRKVIVSKKFEEPKYFAERPGLLLNTLILKEGTDFSTPFDSIQ